MFAWVNKTIIIQSGELGFRFCHLFVRISYWFRNCSDSWCGILHFSIYCTLNYITEKLFFWLVIGYIIHVDFQEYRHFIMHAFVCIVLAPPLSWSYGNWFYNYICNYCISPLKLWVRIPPTWGVLDKTLCDKVCQWQVGGFLRFPPPIKLTATNWNIVGSGV